jgi:hypothetical protein
MMLTGLIIVLLLLLIWFSAAKPNEYYLPYNYLVEPSDQNSKWRLEPFLGHWTWTSKDGLRQQVLGVSLVDGFIQLTLKTDVTLWYPPIHGNNGIEIKGREVLNETNYPLFRVLFLEATRIRLIPSNPKYISEPRFLKLHENAVEYNGKIFLSSLALRQQKINAGPDLKR